MLDRLQGTPTEQRLGTHERLLGVLTLIAEELLDQPLFYEYSQFMNVVKCPVPKVRS